MRVLLTGAGGQLGLSIQDRVPKNWQLSALTSADLDITDPVQIDHVFKTFKPEIVINAAAFTAVDKAEEDEITARSVNALAVKNLAIKCEKTKAFLIHISTDYVFDGRSIMPYRETDILNPISIYGKTKAEGEQAIIRSGVSYAIIRTSWVFSEYGNNFFKTMMRLGKDRESLDIVDDQIGAPTYAGDIADAIIAIARDKNKIKCEIFHYCGDQITTWADFAKYIFTHAFEAEKINHTVVINGISTEQFAAAAPRPKNSVLDCEKIKNSCAIKLSDWQNAVKIIINNHMGK
ncbi:MAG: dTDP-4-dehydrorhamnose reductase [Emcibacteraceae bacterium]|nr:dTDP-4-dehydrorhamnose reductase [Emcibacteraceae bacterium]